jgi:hypothetical protein
MVPDTDINPPITDLTNIDANQQSKLLVLCLFITTTIINIPLWLDLFQNILSIYVIFPMQSRSFRSPDIFVVLNNMNWKIERSAYYSVYTIIFPSCFFSISKLDSLIFLSYSLYLSC